ncbi:MAG: hypothetical protein BroJett029_32780 [Alphaproteobacteria bacterium]|nr:MAG: hypothetical protein BroJett029_32780 [Alphaproteobacteria bacterium]
MERVTAFGTEQLRRLRHQKWTDALATTQRRVTHGLQEACRPGYLASFRPRRQQAAEQRLDLLRGIGDGLLEPGRIAGR